MVTHVKGDFLDSDCDYICHIIDCQGNLSDDLSKHIYERFPEVSKHYLKLFSSKWLQPRDLLGSIEIIETDEKYNIISIYASYSTLSTFKEALEEIRLLVPSCSKIGFQTGINCRVDCKNWTVISAMIEKILGKFYNIYIYEL